MKPILKIKIAVDAAMSVSMLLLMAYGLVGEAAHEWIGMGMHWNMLLAMARKRLRSSKIRTWALRIVGYSFATYGAVAFVRRDVGLYLLLKSHFVFFDYSELLIAFLLDYLAVMGLFVVIGYLVSSIFESIIGSVETTKPAQNE